MEKNLAMLREALFAREAEMAEQFEQVRDEIYAIRNWGVMRSGRRSICVKKCAAMVSRSRSLTAVWQRRFALS